jgi:hypothetical protein
MMLRARVRLLEHELKEVGEDLRRHANQAESSSPRG